MGRVSALTVLALLVGAPGAVLAHSHLWRITEMFSDATGEVQFVEMCECCGSNTEGHLFSDFTFLDTDAKRYFFPSDIGTDPDISAFKCVLTASQAFADLPGAPTPDFILDPNLLPNFFAPGGDTVTYGRVIADYSVIPVPVGGVPTDGVRSLQFDLSGNPSTGVNNPTNFAGETGSVSAGTGSAADFIPGDVNDDGEFDVLDGIVLRRDLVGLEPGISQICLAETPATGQTTCWNSFGSVVECAGTGHDGDVQAGAALSYVDNRDGTITDLNTGLIWEKKSDDGTIHDWDNLYTWDQAFASHVATLNGISFGGHSDWRVPNTKELYSLVDLERLAPSIDPAFHAICTPGCTVTTCSCTVWPRSYRSSTSAASGGALAWFVDFTIGTVFSNLKNDRGPVRAVRGGPPTCGDGLLNQASEECDPPNDAACPGACESDCTCTSLRWWRTCPAPVLCSDVCEQFPSPRTCVDEQAGVACASEGDVCDAGFGCCVVLLCAAEDPRSHGCPISRAEHKLNIRYLDATTRRSIHDEVVRMRLATYNYAEPLADGRTHLGFMIEDNPMSPAVLPSGERVDLYGFMSMAVATLQVQAEEIDGMAAKLADLESMLAEIGTCEP